MNIKMIDERISRFLSRVRQAFRGKISLVNTGSGIQATQVNGLAGEDLPGIELFQHYGFTSAPPAGTTAVIIPVGGKTTHGIIVATEHGSYRLQGLENGEVALYTDEGASIVLKRGKIIETTCDTYNLNCKNFNVNATEGTKFTTPNLEATEQVTAA
ncbi:phage baseplate assembly protein V, partial [Serratia fonticola]|uniref:phage baseplate assembly protein V n=1 Tax=Serratia fonticola TaxID=47917 RepID=UPI00301E0104